MIWPLLVSVAKMTGSLGVRSIPYIVDNALHRLRKGFQFVGVVAAHQRAVLAQLMRVEEVDFAGPVSPLLPARWPLPRTNSTPNTFKKFQNRPELNCVEMRSKVGYRRCHRRVYFSDRPRDFSTGYLSALASIFRDTAAARSTPRSWHR